LTTTELADVDGLAVETGAPVAAELMVKAPTRRTGSDVFDAWLCAGSGDVELLDVLLVTAE
jgi:hypothetical protein